MISIPLFIPHKLFNWEFENNVCVFWLTTDYLLCTASVYNIVLISFDRYQSVSNAVSQNINLSCLEDYIFVNFINFGSLSKKFCLFNWPTLEKPDYPFVGTKFSLAVSEYFLCVWLSHSAASNENGKMSSRIQGKV